MSSTIRTWRPSSGASRSLRIRTTPRGLGRRAVGRDGHEVDLAADVEMAHQVGQEQEGALEDPDQEQVLALVVAGDVLRHRPDAVLQVVRLDEDLADLFAHGAAESRRQASRTRARSSARTRKRSPVATPGTHAISPSETHHGQLRAPLARDLAVGEEVLQRVRLPPRPERPHPVAGPPRADLERGGERTARQASRRRSRRSPARTRARRRHNATRPGTGSATAEGAAGARRLDPHAPVLGDRRAGRRAGRATRFPRRGQREDRVGVRGDARCPPARGVVGEPLEHEPRQRRRQRREVDAGAAPRTLARAASRRAVRRARRPRRAASPACEDVLLRRRMQLAQRGQERRADVAAGGGRVGRVLAPRQPARARSTRRSARASFPAAAARSGPSAPASRAARAGPAKPLAGTARSRPGRWRCGPTAISASSSAASRSRLGVADVARPGLHVAVRRAGAVHRAARTPSRSHSARQCASSASDSAPRSP